jgi:hypothetical protein
MSDNLSASRIGSPPTPSLEQFSWKVPFQKAAALSAAARSKIEAVVFQPSRYTDARARTKVQRQGTEPETMRQDEPL